MSGVEDFRQHVTREEVAFLVMQYLKQERFTRTYETFMAESRHLVSAVSQTRSAKNLQSIVGEYVVLKDAEMERLSFANHFSATCAPLSQMLADLSSVVEAYRSHGGFPQAAAEAAAPTPFLSSHMPSSKRARADPAPDCAPSPPEPMSAAAAAAADAPPSPRRAGRKPMRPRRMAGEANRALQFDEDLLGGFSMAPAPVRSLVYDADFAERIAHAINEQLVESSSAAPTGEGPNITELVERALVNAFDASVAQSSGLPHGGGAHPQAAAKDYADGSASFGGGNLDQFIAELQSTQPH